MHASYVGVYNQSYAPDGVTPTQTLANAFPPISPGSATGTAGFYYAFPIHYKDPSVQQWNATVEQDLGHGIGMRLSYTGSHGKNLETMVDLNQVQPNTTGYYNNVASGTPAPSSSPDCVLDNGTTSPYEIADYRPYPCWSVIQSVENLAESNYNSGTVEVSRRSGKGGTFDGSYMFTRDLSNAGGATPSAFAVSGGSFLTNRFHPGLDYGNVVYDRKHRFLATYLYDLPFGRGQRWLSTGTALNAVVGDWHLGGVAVLQSGPFLTPYETSNDPAGTNILTTVGQTRADLLPNKQLYPAHRTAGEWLLPATDPNSAFVVPAQNRGYFGTAGVGSVVGPGTDVFSMSLRKDLTLHERTRFEFQLEAANVFNHRNYEPPNMQVDATGTFGTITALQTAEGAGPRTLELAGRINF